MVLDTNYALREGEIDLIARDGDTVVFVEVRQRRTVRFGHPAETIDRRKLQRWLKVARRYLVERVGDPDAPTRFDAVVVVGDERHARLDHVRDVV